MLYRTDLPIHSSPVLSRVLPIEHKHTKEPWLFLQSPLIQGLDLHSSTSARDKFKPQVLALSIRYGRHSGDIQYSHTAWVRMSHRPWQVSVSELKTYPLGHWQVKLPGVFLHWPFSHSWLFTIHSSISEGKHEHGKPVVLITMPLYLGGIRDRVTLRSTQSTYRRSFCPSGLPQSHRCRHTCMSLAYSHTRHSGRCQGRGHTH